MIFKTCRRLKTPQFPQGNVPLHRKPPKADNLLKTKGKFSGFCLPKAENMLKISQLANCKVVESEL